MALGIGVWVIGAPYAVERYYVRTIRAISSRSCTRCTKTNEPRYSSSGEAVFQEGCIFSHQATAAVLEGCVVTHVHGYLLQPVEQLE